MTSTAREKPHGGLGHDRFRFRFLVFFAIFVFPFLRFFFNVLSSCSVFRVLPFLVFRFSLLCLPVSHMSFSVSFVSQIFVFYLSVFLFLVSRFLVFAMSRYFRSLVSRFK